VGVIVSQGFELLDALGPYEALKEVQEHYYSKVDIEHRRWKNDADSGIQCNNNNNSGDRTTLVVEVYLASFETNSVRSSSGVPIVPEFDLSMDPEANHFDLLVLGAGSLGEASYTDPTTAEMQYVQQHHDRGGSIVTVCTGASYAALLGLLDGATATTNSLFLDRFRMDYPTVTWMSLADNTNRRFVRSTNSIVTTAGITAGIDGILDAIQKWCGWEVAEATRQCLEWPLSIETNQHKLKHKPAAVTTS
jgi:transcriptional regulator GlxA family with amidase domain